MKGENEAVWRGEVEMKAEIGADMQVDPWIEKIRWMESKGQMFKR